MVLDDDRAALRRLEHAPDPHPSRHVDSTPHLRARAHGGPGVDQRVGADPGAHVHVGRHQDHARLEEAAVARHAGRHHADAGGGQVALDRNLVVELERADLVRGRDAHPEVERDRLLDPSVRHPLASALRFRLCALFGDAQSALIELRDRALDGTSHVWIFERARPRVGRLDHRAPAPNHLEIE